MRRCQADLRKPSFLCASARVEAGDEEVELEELGRYGEVSCWRLERTDGRDRRTNGQTDGRTDAGSEQGGEEALTYSSQHS